jgi:outer membrane beta-barrel protein
MDMKAWKRWVALCVVALSMAAAASEKSVYDFSWLDKDKEIYVLQNRKYRKASRVYVGLSGVKTVSGAFVDSMAGHVRAGFFFHEDWGVEFLYGKYAGTENDTAKGVKEQSTVPFYRKIDNVMGGILWWSPFYAKINTFNEIYYFDWMFGLGAAKVETLDNRNKFLPGRPSGLTSESNTAGLWSTALRFHINQAWSMRLDFTGLHYQADRKSETSSGANDITKKTLFSNYDVGLGIMFAF